MSENNGISEGDIVKADIMKIQKFGKVVETTDKLARDCKVQVGDQKMSLARYYAPEYGRGQDQVIKVDIAGETHKLPESAIEVVDNA